MQTYVDSTDRGPADFLLFAAAFIGFMLGAGGVVLTCPPLALFGALLLLISVFAVGCRSGESQ
jgi:hypothetical protein